MLHGCHFSKFSEAGLGNGGLGGLDLWMMVIARFAVDFYLEQGSL
jgi:hypothetical protein